MEIPDILDYTDYDGSYTTVGPTLNDWCPGLGLNYTEGFCKAIFDNILCWPSTPPNTTLALPCPNFPSNQTILTAYRYCPPDGSWEDFKSDYAPCLELVTTQNNQTLLDPSQLKTAEILRDVYFILSTVSLVLLLLTLFIFQYFRSLQCSRISIHKHLVISFIFRFIINIVIVEPYISRRTSSYRDIDWLCKAVTAINQYTMLANVFWMFVEGFFLHHSLVLGVFSTEPPFKLFYSIGWGFPAIFVLVWSLVLTFRHDSVCWRNYSQIQYYYIITVPFIAALVINLFFLVNIIRVLVSKLRANNRIESANIRKAIKATVVLMPLLGLTNLLFFFNPGDGTTMRLAYHVTNAVLHSSQGIFVAILYCFLNGEVRRVIKQKWYRFKIRHVHHASGRRRSSRTSSFFLPSGTENPNPGAEQLRLVQANLALRQEPFTSIPSTDAVVNGGTSVESSPLVFKRNNNNGEVHFNLQCACVVERESVL